MVLSNHGGRQLDFAPSGIEILPEVMDALHKEKGFNGENFEVYVDGGIRRGSDIFKALALGASGVGIGRPVLVNTSLVIFFVYIKKESKLFYLFKLVIII